jgi:hypothetical protein
MSVSQSEITTARKAARDLVSAVEVLKDHHGDSVDMRRLLADAQRVSEDLDLLVGPEAAPTNDEPHIVVPDHAYPPEFFRDADHD